MIEKLPSGAWVIAEDTHISKWVKEHGTLACDPALFADMKPWLKDTSVVWDIGANIGDHTRFYLDEGKRVIAVEPNPEAFECLKHNCPEALCLNFAASASRGELAFARTDNVGASRIQEGGDLTVPARQMDSLDLPPPDFIKIDVEGWELAALRGMQIALARYRPTVFIEINRGALANNGVFPEDVVEFMASLRYQTPAIYPPSALPSGEQYDLLFRP